MKKFVLPLLMSVLALPVLSTQPLQAKPLNDAQKKEIESLIEQYLLNNGEKIIEGVNNFQVRQETEMQAAAQEQAGALIEELRTDKKIASVGNPEGDVLVVEFLDYNCGYCKRAFSEVRQLLDDDKNVRVIFYDMPILGPSSVVAAKWALAAKKQDKYFALHTALMENQGQLDEATLERLAKDVGIDVKKLAKDINDPAIEEEINAHIEKARSLGIQGTPGFLVETTVFRGYVPYDTLKNAVDEARAEKAGE